MRSRIKLFPPKPPFISSFLFIQTSSGRVIILLPEATKLVRLRFIFETFFSFLKFTFDSVPVSVSQRH